MAPKQSFVLDTSALLALRRDEAGAAEVENLLRRAQKGAIQVFASLMTRMELLYLIRREEGNEAAHEALRLIDSFALEWVSSEPGTLDIASLLKAQGGLSVAGSWIAATAEILGATLVHKDPEFSGCARVRQQVLPG